MEKTENRAYPKLCGGVFASILLSYRGKRIPKTLYYEGIKDPSSNIPSLISLICVADPDYVNHKPAFNSIKKYTSWFLNCREPIAKGLSITTSAYKARFRGLMKNNYNLLLWRMHSFIEDTIGIKDDSGNERIDELSQLVKEIIEIINHDPSCKDVEFPIGPNGLCMNISASNKYHFQSFILGIWAYIVEKSIDNVVDEELMENWKRNTEKGKTVENSIHLIISQPEKPLDEDIPTYEEETVYADETDSTIENDGQDMATDDTDTKTASPESQTNYNSVVINNPVNLRYFEHVDTIEFH